MDPVALSGIDWQFETFAEYLAAREGDLGVNMACYAAHCNIRRWVMGADASERAATEDEVAQMVEMLGEAMEAGAAGLSSTHAPTHNDGDGRPVPSRLAETDELLALATEVGRHQGGSISYLPLSAVGGITQEDMDLLIEIGQASRLPVIIQGLGARSKVDAPTASWEGAVQFLQHAQDEGAAVYSLLLARPFDRPFTLLRGTNLYEGVPAWNDLLQLPVEERMAALSDPATREQLREAVENPNRDPDNGSTLPPPHWKVLFVGQVARDENKDLEGDPQIKARIRGMQMEMSRKRMLADVPTADVIVTNPTHFAVAIKYIAGNPAPMVVAKGQDNMAQIIKKIGRKHRVPIIENKPLARGLYRQVEVGDMIPESLFQAVAEVLAYIYRLKKA
jgi:N-acyl-D-amino-acid deacylase